MRKIKFRAWDKESESMIYLDRVDCAYDFENGKVLAFVVDGYDEFGNHERYSRNPDWEIMQYTGLKDSKGVEIYEGDIMPVGLDKKIRVVIWQETYICFGLHDKDGIWQGMLSKLGWDLEKGEVIGNIYENKDLLK